MASSSVTLIKTSKSDVNGGKSAVLMFSHPSWGRSSVGQNAALSRQRSRVRVSSSPPYFPNHLGMIGAKNLPTQPFIHIIVTKGFGKSVCFPPQIGNKVENELVCCF